MDCNAIFLGGPKHLAVESYPAPPSQRVPVYADAAGDLVCADEQVVERVGHYERVKAADGHYVYYWKPGAS